MEAMMQLADRQLAELERQSTELEASIIDLKALRATAAQEIAKLDRAPGDGA
jgi:peptidoglycan hydrolase CwlO-like protein